MKRKDLIDNIEGSRLKKQFLEAFLLQSTFIEGLLKKLVESSFFSNITLPIIAQQLKAEDKKLGNKYIDFIEEKLLRQNMYEIIEYLAKVDMISQDLKRKLHDYRESRNSVLHDLVGKMSGIAFEKELEELVTKGQLILEDKAMISASESLRSSEEFREITDSKDQEKINTYINSIINNINNR